MKQTAIGVTRIEGSKANNKYDMCRVIVLVPSESRESLTKAGDPYKVSAYGFDTTELDCTQETFHLLKDQKFPASFDFEIDSELRFGRLQSIVVGFVSAQSKTA